jgi:hypothetical protein
VPFSLTSYLLGVGTVVGVIAFGFGGGVLLTNTGKKETAAGVEWAARSEPGPVTAPPQAANAKENPAPPVEPAPAIHSDPASAAQAELPKPDARTETQGAKGPEPTKQIEQPRQSEQREAEQKRAAERKIERQKRQAERKAGEITAARMKQRKLEEQDEPEREEVAIVREEPRFDLFRALSPLPFDHSGNRGDDRRSVIRILQEPD